ncbi:type II toxin-antitoxin system RelE/ParE family toxin [Furfurilactobacillus milii]|uniref:type II toxin-antitoxin system RelE/ParE family toxin n=1 Tax=Furfurilactobacillus milii TaxID=2888272 RepID=UPI001F3CB771|nr:type II toxin-antitoxin system RelE/ParE family toxin [Furfurilactobacillus milii]MCF6419810.1 type II toxin-antitoxin system RelE/ParE family toxin [Furfurilactobacillus milii]
MDINYRNEKLKKQCTSLKDAKRAFDAITAKNLFRKINFIEAADNLQSVINYPPFHFHDLKGERSGTYAMDVNGRNNSYRIICSFDAPKTHVFSEASTITIMEIEEVSNHYE